MFCVRADDRHAATAWTPGGDPARRGHRGGARRRRPAPAVAVRDAIRERLAGAAARPAAGAGPATQAAAVALVGGGPGDPELITVAGRRLLAAADVVVADRLAPGLLLDELRAGRRARRRGEDPVRAGARRRRRSTGSWSSGPGPGQFVVRLKGGDPYVFGRGGEEVIACAEAGVPVTVVPGVTSAIAVPGAGRHPGHPPRASRTSSPSSPGTCRPDTRSRWSTGPALARLRGTLVRPHGAEEPAAIAPTLIAHGRRRRPRPP